MAKVSFDFPSAGKILSISVSYEAYHRDELLNCRHEVTNWDMDDNRNDLLNGFGEIKGQPTVPIQFVYYERISVLRSVKDASMLDYINCTVEQIGAVLYVREK